MFSELRTGPIAHNIRCGFTNQITGLIAVLHVNLARHLAGLVVVKITVNAASIFRGEYYRIFGMEYPMADVPLRNYSLTHSRNCWRLPMPGIFNVNGDIMGRATQPQL